MIQKIIHTIFIVALVNPACIQEPDRLECVTMKGLQMAQFDSNKTVFLIDGSGFLYRAYYALRPLHTSTGIPVQAVYSFCRMIKKLADNFNPQYMALVWDSKGKTERHTLYPAYKATRQEPPSDLFTQKQYITEFADLIGMRQIAQTGVEADDLLYSLARDLQAQGNTVVIISSDKDMAQAITQAITLFDPYKDIFINAESFAAKMGFAVEKLPFYFALLGDTSDNIPGVKGIGEKGATELVQQFASLSDLYANLDQVKKERTRAALEANKENAFLSEQLFLLKYHALGLHKQDFAFSLATWPQAMPLFKQLEFKSMVKELEVESATPSAEAVVLSQAKGYQFKTVTTPAQLQEMCTAIKERGIVAIDTELDGLNPLQDTVVGVCLACEVGTAYYVPYGHKVMELQLTHAEIFAALQPIFADPTIKKIFHHAKFDQLALWSAGSTVTNVVFDTLLAACLVTPDWQKIGLKALSEHYLNESMLTFADVVQKNKYKNFSYVPLTLATEYGASDAHQTLQLWPLLEKQLQEQDMARLYYDIELPLLQVLLAMEEEGIFVDRDVLAQLDVVVSRDLNELREQIAALIGEEFKDINLNSPKQLEHLFFTHLQLPPQKKSSKKTGYSTDVEVLQELARLHPVPGLILKYRELYKLKSTYIDALPTYINKKTGKVHTDFSQTKVATGRLASSDPNLQNIPTHTPGYDIHVRSAFKPEPGHVFLSADYSQIELRVLAYFSQDELLVESFLHDIDIHAQTAARLFDVPLNAVTNEQRQIGKRINFSILYGLTPFGLSKDLDIPFKEAKNYIEKYFAQYPKVQLWMDEVIAHTKECGYVTTLWGRRRYIPGIYEKNRMLYDLARRIAINTRAQGTAAEIMKLGMVNLSKAFKEHNLQAKMILQIHDELLISVPIAQKEQTEKLVKQVLESVVQWNIPLVVTTRFGADWQEVTK